MASAEKPWWGRIFGKPDEPAHPSSSATDPAVQLPVRGATLGLCFDYERDLAFDSAVLADAGLERILATLQRHRLRATFNCAARLCEDVPHQIRMIAEAGHELAVFGYAGESWAELSQDMIKQLAYRCRNAFAKCGFTPIGFRSKSTQCTEVMARELMLQRFRYNSQHDHARQPFILIPGDVPFVRVPVCTDDRGYVRTKHEAKKAANTVVSKHHRYLRKAIMRGHFVSIGFHPWILAEEESRMADWEEWLETAIRGKARIGALEDALPASYRRVSASDGDE